MELIVLKCAEICCRICTYTNYLQIFRIFIFDGASVFRLDSLQKMTALMPLICKFVWLSFFFLSLLSLFMSHLRRTSLLTSFTYTFPTPSTFSCNPYPRTCLWLFPLHVSIRKFDEKAAGRGKEFLEFLELAPNTKNARKVRWKIFKEHNEDNLHVLCELLFGSTSIILYVSELLFSMWTEKRVLFYQEINSHIAYSTSSS